MNISFTIVFTKLTDIGKLQTDGFNYSGFIGMVQRGEGDFNTWNSIRTDSLEFEAVAFGPPMYSGDLSLWASISKYEKSVDMTDVFFKMNGMTFYYVLIMAFYVSLCLMAFFDFVLTTKKCITKKRKKLQCFNRHYRRFIRQLRKLVIKLLYLIIDQKDLNNSWQSSRVLWTSLSIGSFVIVFGYMLNLMSSELVTDVPVRRIEGLGDLLDHELFKEKKIFSVNSIFNYASLRNNDPTTQMGRLYKRFKLCDNGTIFFDGKKSTMDIFLGAIERINVDVARDGQIAILPQVYQSSLWPFVCSIENLAYKPQDIYEPKDTFDQGIVANYHFKGMDPMIRQFVNWRQGLMFEANLYTLFNKQRFMDILFEVNLNYNYKAFVCHNKLNQTIDVNPITAMKTEHYGFTFNVFGYGLLVAFVSLIGELLFEWLFIQSLNYLIQTS